MLDDVVEEVARHYYSDLARPTPDRARIEPALRKSITFAAVRKTHSIFLQSGKRPN
jgi:hypothetical protein